jgi:hypothetical protein
MLPLHARIDIEARDRERDSIIQAHAGAAAGGRRHAP